MKTTLAVLALLLFAGVSQADSLNVTGTWDYVGNTMQGCGCALSGQIVLDASGVPTAWTFTDGTHTLDTSDSTLYLAYLTFFFRPSEIEWSFSVADDSDPNVGIFSQFYGSAFESDDVAWGSRESGNEGVWTESVPTAEPGTLALIGVGLAGLLARKRLQAKRNQVPEAVWEPLA